MKGHINISTEEVIYGGRAANQFAIDCDILTKGLHEKMALVHTFCRALNFTPLEYKILSLAADKDCWPDEDADAIKFSADRKAIQKAQEAMGGNEHDV